MTTQKDNNSLGFADGFQVADGETIPGWSPPHAEKNSDRKEAILATKRQEQNIVSTADAIKGKLQQIGRSFGKNVYSLVEATTANIGKNGAFVVEREFDELRVPESVGLYDQLSRVEIGAEVLIQYKGSAPIKGKANHTAHRWILSVKDKSQLRLTAREDALLPDNNVEKLTRDIARLIQAKGEEKQIAMLEARKQAILDGKEDIVDGEFSSVDEFTDSM
jgi:hypothetical protein